MTALGVLAAAATLACLSFLVRAHTLPTGYDPVRDPVSDYGVGRFSAWYACSTGSIALAALLVAAALRREDASWLVLVPLVVFALARLAIPHFPTDLEGERPSRVGANHILLAAIAFAAICWAMCDFRPDWGRWLPWLGYLATAGAVGTLASLRRAPFLRPWTGLLERVFYAAMLAWFLAVSVQLVRI